MKITEAMSEIKLFANKIESQSDFIYRNLKRPENIKDPFDKDGSTQQAQVNAAIQSINDLESNIVHYRSAITKANMEQIVELEGIKMSVAEWLIWRREVYPIRKHMLTTLAHGLASRNEEGRRGDFGRGEVNMQPVDYIVNVSDKWLLAEIQKLETIEQRLDGQLSMLNATVDVTV